MEPTDILGNIKLYNADCMEVMKTFNDKQFSLAICDPPYGIGMDNMKTRTKPSRPNTYNNKNKKKYISAGDWDNKIPSKEYYDELFRVSKNQIVWGANYMCNMLPSGYGGIYWDKQMGDNNFSSGEFAFCSMQVKLSAITIPSMRVQGTRIHPTEKPVQLYKWLLQNYAKEGDTILDTHFGSLSIGIACHDLKFDLTAIELDKDYYEQAKQRLFNHQRQLTLF